MVNRRQYMIAAAGAAASLSGCIEEIVEHSENDPPTTDSSTETEPADSEHQTPEPSDTETETETVDAINNPWGKETLTVSLTRETTGQHDIHEAIETALTYWDDNSQRYAGFDIAYNYQPNSDTADINIRIVDEITDCGEHELENVVGCAPIIHTTAPDVADVRIVNDITGEHLITIIKHELGHTLGLGHTDEPQHIMSNDLEHRIPDYNDRKFIVDTYSSGIESHNNAWDAYSDAITAYDNENLSKATTILETAETRFRNARDQFLTSEDTAFQLGESETVSMCETAAERCYELVQSMRYLTEALTAYQSNRYDEGDEYIDTHQKHHANAQDLRVRSGQAVAESLGLPV